MKAWAGLALLVIACNPALPDIADQDDELAGERVEHPNVVLSINAGEQSLFCDQDALDCMIMGQGCQDVPVLGPPDDLRLEMNQGDTLVVASSCGAFLENGNDNTSEIRLFGISDNSFRAVLEVSFDGQEYRALNEISTPSTEEFDFDFSRVDIEVVQYLRFSITDGGPFYLDAFQHLITNAN